MSKTFYSFLLRRVKSPFQYRAQARRNLGSTQWTSAKNNWADNKLWLTRSLSLDENNFSIAMCSENFQTNLNFYKDGNVIIYHQCWFFLKLGFNNIFVVPMFTIMEESHSWGWGSLLLMRSRKWGWNSLTELDDGDGYRGEESMIKIWLRNSEDLQRYDNLKFQ